MEDTYIVSGYHITTNPTFQNERDGITNELERQFESLYLESQDKKNKKIIDRLNNLILEFPKSPQLKNFLSVAFSVQGKLNKALEVNDWIITEHPDYLFAKLNKASQYINKAEYEKVLQVLGPRMEIKELYPNREIFHLAEVSGFYKVAINYYAATDNYELAENRLEILKKIAPNHADTEAAEMYVLQMQLRRGAARMAEENKLRITPTKAKEIPTSKIQSAPIFSHTQINNLYSFGISISENKLKEIIDLPRATLITDLESVLIDAVNRYDYFIKKSEGDDNHDIVLHSLLLLKEIRAYESLPKIISFLEYDYEFLDFWLGDHKTETLWQCFYTLGFDQTDLLKNLLLRPSVDTYIKTSASEAMCQMVLHHPEKRNEILAIFKDVFTAFLNASFDDDLIDSDFLGLSIGDAIYCDFFELLPIIKELYNKRYVNTFICGGYGIVEKEFKKGVNTRKKISIKSIFEIYDDTLKNWAGYANERDDFDEYLPILPIKNAVEKIGRNEPCPCGSGKKYKKCCL